ncbi:fumarylacetoacetate hydrolase family protein [Carboxydochorda subterranea]|uniref:Fumarylacetoacetate hydrolase family protein n=1 Tax=Carboxydichorda subterranea TaxID=3109565 RepID=A0ABZ1BYH0_9FIRM|nr:fumarylacetoacetate hydrolase family protein [Limnochorda sp. L945t]WRP17837.1 fumarylacetoacetate hydrolase family protein [Limnochorda sp. L945t]
MKLATIHRGGEAHLVVRAGAGMVDVTQAARTPGWSTGELPLSLIGLVRAWGAGDRRPMEAVRRLVEAAEQGRYGEILDPEAPEIEWLPPVVPSKVMCIGLNYWDHCREQHVDPPKRPILFAKWPNAYNAHRRPIAMAEGSDQVDFEAELAVIIGRRSRRLVDATALEAVFGYTTFNDVTARDYQKGDGQWVRGKSQDTFAPMGPWVATADEIPDPQKLRIVCRVNGVAYQDSSTAEMIFPVRALLAFISQGITLEPGDVLATGTPDGVGVYRKPPVFLKPGDVVEVEIERIGRLVNPVVRAAEASALDLDVRWPG